MDECPKCNRWTLNYDPRTETQICINCGYRRHINYDDFIEEKNIINNLLYPSRISIAESKESKQTLKAKYAFYFYSSVDHSTGESATSLEEFAEKIRQVDIKSLEFHFHRRDFENWVIDSLGDTKLTKEINNLHKQNPAGETLRNKLYNMVSKRSVEMKTKPLAIA